MTTRWHGRFLVLVQGHQPRRRAVFCCVAKRDRRIRLTTRSSQTDLAARHRPIRPPRALTVNLGPVRLRSGAEPVAAGWVHLGGNASERCNSMPAHNVSISCTIFEHTPSLGSVGLAHHEMIPIQRNTAVEEQRQRKRAVEMTPNLERQTAKIYAFPPGGRRNLRQRDVSTSAYSPLGAESKMAPNIACGSSWYHEAAVEEVQGH